MNPVATRTQRRAVLSQIDRAERQMIPAGWTFDEESEGTRSARAAIEHAARTPMPQPLLLDTGAPQPTAAPRPREVRLTPMPPTGTAAANNRARRITWALIALWCTGWVVGPIAWWLSR